MANLLAPFAPFAPFARALIELLCAIKFHFTALYIQTDPLEYSFKFASQKALKLQNLVPIFILIYTPLYGIFGLHYEAYGELFHWSNLTGNPYIFTHQIVLRPLWTLIDVAVGLDVVCAVPIYIARLLTPSLGEKSRVYLNDEHLIVLGTQVLSEIETAKILRQRKFIKLIFLYLLPLMCWLMFGAYFEAVALFVNRMYFLSIPSIIFWITFPIFMFYVVFGVLASVSYVILASIYLHVHQVTLLEKIQAQNQHLLSSSDMNSDLSIEFSERMHFQAHWILFKRVNSDIIKTCKVIKELNRCCGPLLSLIVPFYITLQCYLLCIVLFVDNVPMREFFAFDVAEVNVFLFAVTNQCARVVKANSKLEKQSRKFHFNFMRKCNSANAVLYLQTENLQATRRLYSFAFRLFGFYRITGKSYYLIVTYISSFFMFIAKKD